MSEQYKIHAIGYSDGLHNLPPSLKYRHLATYKRGYSVGKLARKMRRG